MKESLSLAENQKRGLDAHLGRKGKFTGRMKKGKESVGKDQKEKLERMLSRMA